MSRATALSDSPPAVALDPRERIEQLCDPGSIHVLRSAVQSRRMGTGARAGDGVLAASGAIGGRPVFCYAQDYSFAGGSLGEVHAETIVRVLSLAARAQVPVVGMIESAGARVQEATAALSGYARVFSGTVALSGRVPGLDRERDIRRRRLLRPGADRLRGDDGIGEHVPHRAQRGARRARRGGVDVRPGRRRRPCPQRRLPFVVPEQSDAALLTRELLSYLPQNVAEAPPPLPLRGAAHGPHRGVCAARSATGL